MMSIDGHGFLEWKEEFVSQERGSRVVHYFLKDTAGESVLAVVGTERSLRHMVYVVEDSFMEVYGSEMSITSCFKWRSRREVVDWLTSQLVKQHAPRDCSKSPKNDLSRAFGSPSSSVKGLNALESCALDHMGRFARELKGHNSDILWSGDSWTCGKQLTHYPTFCRSGTIIAIHSFVLIMAKEENHYLAYLEDMYEDRKGQKKVKVRWFHYKQEVEAVIRLRNTHPREVFITPHSQVISVECVDGPATVLSPEHYEKCLAALPHTSSDRVYFCFRQFRSNRVKPFDLSKLKGYFDQAILSCLEEEDFHQEKRVKQGSKRVRSCRGQPSFVTNRSVVRVTGRRSETITSGPAYQNLRFGVSGSRSLMAKNVGLPPWLSLPFKVDEKIELLCQDSGIRGCWFRCTVLQTSWKQLKVQYDDLQNEDEPGNLQEWIPAFRLASPDKLGLRCSGRLRIRPCPPEDLACRAFEIGTPVDAWWSDGWWEGVVTGNHSHGDDSLQVYFPGKLFIAEFNLYGLVIVNLQYGDDSLQAYFPGEDRFVVILKQNLRHSRDWVGNQWVDIKTKPDIHTIISTAVSHVTKFSSCTTYAAFSGSAMSNREVPTISKLDTVEENKEDLDGSAGSNGISENTNWVSSRKRPRSEDEGTRGDGDDHNDDDAKDQNKNDIEKDKVDTKEEITETDQEGKRGSDNDDGKDGGHDEIDENKDVSKKDKVDTKGDLTIQKKDENNDEGEDKLVKQEEIAETDQEGKRGSDNDDGKDGGHDEIDENKDVSKKDKVDTKGEVMEIDYEGTGDAVNDFHDEKDESNNEPPMKGLSGEPDMPNDRSGAQILMGTCLTIQKKDENNDEGEDKLVKQEEIAENDHESKRGDGDDLHVEKDEDTDDGKNEKLDMKETCDEIIEAIEFMEVVPENN